VHQPIDTKKYTPQVSHAICRQTASFPEASLRTKCEALAANSNAEKDRQGTIGALILKEFARFDSRKE
jgi:hypothetical protein